MSRGNGNLIISMIAVAAAFVLTGCGGGVGGGNNAFTASKEGEVFGLTDDLAMVSVQGGTFTMGCTGEQGSYCYDSEKPAHSVTVGNFNIGKFEVTQRLWKQIMGADNNPSNFKGDDLPVEGVSWNDVQEFIKKLNEQTGKKYRLPTEAEWEYAARGGNQSRGYKYSGSNNIDDVAWYVGNRGGKTHRVGTKQPNELGIYDMSGNVWEWVSDWHGGYIDGAMTNPTGSTSGSFRVARGGSWDGDARCCRVSHRNGGNPSNRDYDLGFRLALSP
jgi:formylglycine-generating enzyme required for sulfatase activity